jgi:putative hemolysin
VVDGLSTLDEFAEQTGFVLPSGPYDTVAGYFMAQLGQLPAVGDAIQTSVRRVDGDAGDITALELKVAELDGRRASTLVVHRVDGGELQPPED